MHFDFFKGLEIIGDLLNLFSSSSETLSFNEKNKSEKKSKYKVELWSGGFVLLASILFFIIFRNSLPEDNYWQTLIICSLIGFVISFILFFILYHLGLYYF